MSLYVLQLEEIKYFNFKICLNLKKKDKDIKEIKVEAEQKYIQTTMIEVRIQDPEEVPVVEICLKTMMMHVLWVPCQEGQPASFELEVGEICKRDKKIWPLKEVHQY